MMFVARYVQVGVLVSAGLFALFGNGTATAEAQRDVTFALYERLQHMEERVQTLNGQVEVLNHQLHSMQQKQLAQFKDLDARLVKLAQTPSRSAPMTQALGQSPSSAANASSGNAGNLAATPAAAITANTATATAPTNANAYTSANAHMNANTSAYAKANAYVNANPYNINSNTNSNMNANAYSAAAKAPAFAATQTPAMTGTVETELTAQLAAPAATGSRSSPPSSAPMTTATLPPSYPTPATPARALSDKEEYQLAYAYIREKRYTLAQTALSQFLKSHAKSPYAANAHYWLGELNLLSGDIHGALQQFESIVTRYPQNNKMPDALLKLGYIYDDMGQFAKARTYLERLPAQYAGSTAAQLALVRLQQMRQSTY